MELVFSQVLNMSLTASVVILCVMAARLLLKKAPKIFSYALWAVVLFRLLCPVSLASEVSVLELTQPQVAQASNVSVVYYTPVESALEESGWQSTPVQREPISIRELERQQADTAPTVMGIASWLWLAGIAVMVLYSIVTYLRLYRDLIGAVRLKKNIYLADHIQSPFVLGLYRPRIYLPSGIPMEERRYIIAHERHHIRRCDHLIKLLAYAALCIHWFNPLVWAAFLLAGKDMEMSCDEAVIKKLGEHIRADYSASLLRLATGRRLIAGTPLAFGEGDTKGRVLNMAKWKKPKVWVSILCVVLCVVILIVCAVNPEEEKSIEELTRMTNEGPTSGAYGNLNYTLPGGITHELREIENYDEALKKVLRGEENRNIHVTVWSVDGVEIGGIQDHLLPAGMSTDGLDWIHSLDLWEWEVENLGYFAGDSVYGIAEAEFFSDVPPGTEIEPVERKHYFFLDEDGRRVYDIWFDMLTVDPTVMEAILKSAVVGGDSPLPVETDVVPTIPEVILQDLFIQYGGLTMTLPDGCSARETEEGSVALTKDDADVGGITHWPMPDSSMEDLEAWVCDLGIPEALEARELRKAREAGLTEESIAFMIEGGGDYLSAWYGNELDYSKLNKEHNLFIADTVVYDIWYDQNVLSDAEAEKFLETVYISGEPTALTAPEEDMQTVPAGSIPPGYSIQVGQFPKGYTFEMDGYGNVLFLEGSNTIGGLTSYAIPEGVYDPQDTSFRWLEEVGIPDYEDSSLRYGYLNFLDMDNEWSVKFTSDVPEGTEPTVDRYHTFYVIGDRVFDCWVDLLQVEWDIFMDIRDAVKIIDNTEPGETEALYKCHAVLNAVQSGSSHILLERRYDAGISDYTQEYLQHRNGNHNEWLSIITVQIAGTAEKHANLYAGGTYYSNMGKWNKEEILWTEMMTEADPLRPWLTSFQWNQETVTYMDTLTDDSGECVMLRIDEPFAAKTEEAEEHYFVNFYFDPQGNFVNTKITVDLSTEDEFTQTEAIVTLENLTVYTKINEQYRNATGKSLTGQTVEGNPVVTTIDLTEQQALEKCRAVLDLVQSSEGYQIRTDSVSEGENVLNDSAIEWYSRHGEDWLSIMELPGVYGVVDGEPVDFERKGYLYKNGAYYSNEADGELDAGNAIRWSQSREPEVSAPWLASFDWDAQIVECLGVLPEAGGECVSLFVIDPKYNGEKRLVTYSAMFHFDEEGNFRNVVLTAVLPDESGGDYNVESTESILSLDADVVAAEIEKEYQRAIG